MDEDQTFKDKDYVGLTSYNKPKSPTTLLDRKNLGETVGIPLPSRAPRHDFTSGGPTLEAKFRGGRIIGRTATAHGGRPCWGGCRRVHPLPQWGSGGILPRD